MGCVARKYKRHSERARVQMTRGTMFELVRMDKRWGELFRCGVHACAMPVAFIVIIVTQQQR